MNDKRDDFHKQAKNHFAVSLSPERKRAMLANIYHSVEAAPKSTTLSPWSFSFFASHRYSMAMVAVLMLATTTTMASTYSLPGDPLYNFKVNVLEPLQLSLILNDADRAAYKIELLERRAEEVRQLHEREGSVPEVVPPESFEAAEATLMRMEETTTTDTTGGMVETRARVDAYNAFSENEGLRMDTMIQAKVGDQEESATTSTSTEERNAKGMPEEVLDEVEENVKKKIDEVIPQVEGVVDEVEDAIDEVEKIVKPATEILGL